MKRINQIIYLLLSLLLFTDSAIASEQLIKWKELSAIASERSIKWKELMKQTKGCTPVGLLEHHEFTRRNINDLKFFLQKIIDVMTSGNIYSVMDDYHLSGGEQLPKKLFAPTVRGVIYATYLFKEAEGNSPCVYDRYSAFFKKQPHKHWNFVAVNIPSDFKGVSTQFSDQDFEDFQLIFDKKFILEDINVHNQHLYSISTYAERELKDEKYLNKIKKYCYGVYVFHKTEKGVPLRFTFCVNRENYHENDKYPYNFGRLAIERLD